MNTSTKIYLWLAAAARAYLVGFSFLYSHHLFLCFLLFAGVIAGIVNFFYIILNLPLNPPQSSGPKPLGLLNISDTNKGHIFNYK